MPVIKRVQDKYNPSKIHIFECFEGQVYYNQAMSGTGYKKLYAYTKIENTGYGHVWEETKDYLANYDCCVCPIDLTDKRHPKAA